MSQIVIHYLQFYSVTDEIEKIALDHSSSFIDVKIPLQCLVKNSQIVVHTSVKVSFKLSICSLITFYILIKTKLLNKNSQQRERKKEDQEIQKESAICVDYNIIQSKKTLESFFACCIASSF